MAAAQRFEIEVWSASKDFWRYNITLLCGCFDAAGSRTGIVSAERRRTDAEQRSQAAPGTRAADEPLKLVTEPCDRITLYVYLVPHTLPESRDIYESPPFEFHVRVTGGGRTLYDCDLPVNQWSGASAAIDLPEEQTAG